MTLVSKCKATQGKQLTKKLLLSMTVASLKALCSKLFKVEALNILLVYKEEGYEDDYPLEEDQRELSFFSVQDGGCIMVDELE